MSMTWKGFVSVVREALAMTSALHNAPRTRPMTADEMRNEIARLEARIPQLIADATAEAFMGAEFDIRCIQRLEAALTGKGKPPHVVVYPGRYARLEVT
jgi:hypothetical protein